ncbi:uncharacterized protein LOC118433617 isoform X2 [Folsomia candida]|uniref:uncharacterized protein LOC118433617 isoform X2 n=1 Tax=Folsomia candida TaxID=158441 RepID=UPI0016052764|nr:uncharacterized protein LOC118433617 isoform X2 [Folsomia candida]
MAAYIGPQQPHQHSASSHHRPTEALSSSPLHQFHPELHQKFHHQHDQTMAAPHLRHGHHLHHPNSSGPGNFTFLQHSLMEALGSNNSHNPPPSAAEQYFSSTSNSTTSNFTFPFPFRNNGNFSSSTAAATFMTKAGDGLKSQSSDLVKLMLKPSDPPFPLNMSISDIEEDFSSYDNSTTFLLTNTTSIIGNATGTTGTSGPPSFIASLYAIIVPVMIFFCVLTCIVNLVIVISARWCRKPMSPTLYYSISLALADAYSSFILGVGLTINSLLPTVYKIKLTECLSLTVEAFRSGGVLVTVCHLLALGVNHWIGIARPLHYASTMTRRTAWIVIILSWSCPILMLLVYYSSISNQGYLSPDCSNNHFMKRWTYRVFYASCFFAPLFLLSLIYIHIFLIVRSHQTNRLRYQSSQALRKNVKAALTTVLILGTYIVGWMPATLYNIIACEDCIISLSDVPPKYRYAIGITVNVLVILKTFVDPIIYAARMSDIQLSLRKMKYDFLQLFCKACVHSIPPPENDRGYFASTTRTFSKFNRSLYDTKSIRMSSFGSSSSSRRTAASAAAANLINNSPGSQSNHNHGDSTSSGGFGNSFNYKNHNGNNSSPKPNQLLSSHPTTKSQLLHTKSAFEMTEMR